MRDVAVLLNDLKSGSVTRGEIGRLAATYDLAEAWARFESRFLDD